MVEKKGFVVWVKDHRKQLLLAGISVTAILGVIIGFKNKEAILDLQNFLEKSIMKVPGKFSESMSVSQATAPALEKAILVRSYTSSQEAFDVSQHIRNMSGGRHHSAKKAAEAAAMGIYLLPNQTIVDTYTKCAA